MKWRTKQKKDRSIGTKRTVSHFAWLPTNLDTGFTVWLEFYWSDQVWTLLHDFEYYCDYLDWETVSIYS